TGVLPSIVTSNLMGAAGLAFLRSRLPLWVLVLIIVFFALLLFAAGILVIRLFYFRDKAGTPESMTSLLVFFVIRLLMMNRQKLVIQDEKLSEAEAPYVMLVNHESFFDFYYISRMHHPKNPAYLMNEHYTSRPGCKGIAKSMGLIPKKLFYPDMVSVAGIMRTVRSGFPVVIFPEARLSPDGRSNEIVEKGAAFYQKLGCDLVLTKLSGAYFAKPKWRKRMYRSRITVSVERVLKKDELAAMTSDALDALIAETLYQDASVSTRTHYRQNTKAVGLEQVLYRCADCGSLYTTVGRKNTLICTKCKSSHTLDETYHFVSGPPTVSAYYDAIRAMEEREAHSFVLEADVHTKIFGANGGPARQENGHCRLDPSGFRYVSPSCDLTVPIGQFPALAFSCGKEFEFYHMNELYYFYPVQDPVQVVRWAMFVDILSKKRRAEAPRDNA
ncbi:MAG: 1-acyl-sn-glycerol-3-phosphate acyltransferase, partial [Lachnospiraceae bacterium]|nr:1-acyl-sn-glycerol-3-phosphate acyltransferase [Lachnospiraceae bacterium]